MLSNLEALQALAAEGTMGRAGRRLRLSQSAVSKRIAALEAELGTELIARDGRHVVLTGRGERLLTRLAPLVAELKAALADEDAASGGTVTLGVSESILGSWGPDLLATARARVKGLKLELHAHRSPSVVERVAAGEYMAGLIAGHATDAVGLAVVEWAKEPMAMILAPGAPTRTRAQRLPLIGIEARSGTWDAIARVAQKHKLEPTVRVESFFAVVRLALAGEGNGLVPLGVAQSLGVPERQVRRIPGLGRPISLIARPSIAARPAVQALFQSLASERDRFVKRWR